MNAFFFNQIWLFYGGSDGCHTDWRQGFLCLATLRPDGFAGYKGLSDAAISRINTRPLQMTTDDLKLTVDIQREGRLLASILDSHNQPLANSVPIKEITGENIIQWEGGFELGKIKEKTVKLQFEFQNATLYSFDL